ncbi:hypothetical protein CEXT_25441 [Caerostris extrusa]|uniref:Uncharacterized protein n=1 Tax=Caerostris extrusa TaxID=172846 RepID=A0AAV4YCA3_CAEEX|nr:hypothetical protein CEXT_25441 [Caerostris extrusa]
MATPQNVASVLILHYQLTIVHRDPICLKVDLTHLMDAAGGLNLEPLKVPSNDQNSFTPSLLHKILQQIEYPLQTNVSFVKILP